MALRRVHRPPPRLLRAAGRRGHGAVELAPRRAGLPPVRGRGAGVPGPGSPGDDAGPAGPVRVPSAQMQRGTGDRVMSREQIHRCDVGGETTPAEKLDGWHIFQVKDMFGQTYEVALCPVHWPDAK